MREEEWRPCPRCETRYSVSNIGRIRRDASYNSTYAGRIITLHEAPTGYPLVTLRNDGGKRGGKRILVHQLVALAFIGPRPTGYHVNHKNGIKSDNRVDNLEYVTPSENIQHALRLGLTTHGAQRYNAKLTATQAADIKASAAKGTTHRVLAERFNVSRGLISHICTGLSWSRAIAQVSEVAHG